MENESISELGALLKGEQMAISAYERYIHGIKEKSTRSELKKIQEDHKKHANIISQRIQELGGKAEFGTGLAGFMATVKSAIDSMESKDALNILNRAYDGEDKGIAKAEELVKGDLDQESARMVNEILSVDHDHLKTLANLMEKFQSDH